MVMAKPAPRHPSIFLGILVEATEPLAESVSFKLHDGIFTRGQNRGMSKLCKEGFAMVASHHLRSAIRTILV